MVFLKIGEIDTLKEQYEADVMIKAKWREPSLDKNNGNVSGVRWEDILGRLGQPIKMHKMAPNGTNRMCFTCIAY